MNELSIANAASVAESHWHVRGRVDVLPSYLDQNFRIRGVDGDYVLKVAHPSWQRADLDLENCAMLALAKNATSVAWPQVLFTTDGQHLLSLLRDGQTRFVRLLSFVPGLTWAGAIENVPMAQRAALHSSLGTTIARLDRGLADFQHPRVARPHPWNLMRLPELVDGIQDIADTTLRRRVATHMAAFTVALPEWHHSLPVAVVHNDANDLNVLVAAADNGSWRVRSIIDFGDMCTSFRITELAIACTYAMQYERDMLACVHDVVRGYMAINPLQVVEIKALHAFITARACQSILIATRAGRKQPGNAHILVSQQGMRRVLDELSCIPPAAIAAPFTHL